MKAPSAFDWASSPSLLAAELKPLKNGLSRSQTATRAVKNKEQRTGINPGTIHNLSPKSEAQLRLRRGRAA